MYSLWMDYGETPLLTIDEWARSDMGQSCCMRKPVWPRLAGWWIAFVHCVGEKWKLPSISSRLGCRSALFPRPHFNGAASMWFNMLPLDPTVLSHIWESLVMIWTTELNFELTFDGIESFCDGIGICWMNLKLIFEARWIHQEEFGVLLLLFVYF